MKTINDYAELVKEKHALNKTIAPVETNETDASRAYAVGEQLIFNGTLYDVIVPISQHDVITTTGSGANIAPSGSISAKIQTLTKEVDSIVNDLSAKNILKNNASNYSSQGVSFVVNADKTVNVTSAPSTGTASIYINSGFEIKPGTYKLSALPKDFDGGYQKAQVYVQYRNSQNVWADLGWDDKGVNNNGNEIHTFSESTFIRVALVVYSEKTYDFVVKPMIYPSDIANDDYVQFAMTNRELTDVVTPVKGSFTYLGATWYYKVFKDYIVIGSDDAVSARMDASAWTVMATITELAGVFHYALNGMLFPNNGDVLKLNLQTNGELRYYRLKEGDRTGLYIQDNATLYDIRG